MQVRSWGRADIFWLLSKVLNISGVYIHVVWRGLHCCIQVGGEYAGSCLWTVFSWKRTGWVIWRSFKDSKLGRKKCILIGHSFNLVNLLICGKLTCRRLCPDVLIDCRTVGQPWVVGHWRRCLCTWRRTQCRRSCSAERARRDTRILNCDVSRSVSAQTPPDYPLYICTRHN